MPSAFLVSNRSEQKIRRLINRVVFALRHVSRQVSKRLLYFTFNDARYRYFYHRYNETWNNERAVEIPIVWNEVEQHDAERILEVGNVLSHYYPVHHDVVDKHEKGDGIINADVVDFHPEKKYDLIVSISTLEHVGFNEEGFSEQPGLMAHPEKTLHAIQNLKGLLSHRGKIIATVPLGYNVALDQLLREGNKSIFTSTFYLKRVSRNNHWVEVEEEGIGHAKYNYQFRYANALAVCVFEATI
jgi:hypothetical protein